MSELMSAGGDSPCDSCGKRRPLVDVTFKDTTSFRCCTSCAVLAIREHSGPITATLDFEVER